ncbi:MAG TPA: polyhydroxyalkanoate granule-associated phasin [Burkholderiales bacterium]|nr:polyhydroxyalkanoate granule-associated phasin [Burkholderiales bacterium]
MRRVKPSRKTASIRKITELAVAAPQVVAIRTARMLAAGAHPGATDRAEFSLMGREKIAAAAESMFAMAAQMVKTQQEYARAAALQWWKLWTTPWLFGAYRPLVQTLASLPQAALIAVPTPTQRRRAVGKLVEAAVTPVHKRATGNARRLGKIKKR